MVEYKNKTGTITKIEDGMVFINGDPILTDTERSRERMRCAKPKVGDNVRFNIHDKTGELIYLQVFVGSGLQQNYERRSYGTNFPIFGLGGGGEMANMALDSHDPYDEWSEGEYM